MSIFCSSVSPNGKCLYFNQPHVQAVVVLTSLNSSLKWDPSENVTLLFLFLQTYMTVRNSTQILTQVLSLATVVLLGDTELFKHQMKMFRHLEKPAVLGYAGTLWQPGIMVRCSI